MLARLKLWWTLSQINAAERKEEELKSELRYVQTKILPTLRGRRNALQFGKALR